MKWKKQSNQKNIRNKTVEGIGTQKSASVLCFYLDLSDEQRPEMLGEEYAVK